jgi:hypothetical protein
VPNGAGATADDSIKHVPLCFDIGILRKWTTSIRQFSKSAGRCIERPSVMSLYSRHYTARFV